MFCLSWLSVVIETTDTGDATVTFKQIGQIALDGVDGALLAKLNEARDGAAVNAPRSGLPGEPGTNLETASHRRDNGQPSIARQGEDPSAMGVKDGGATKLNSAELLPLWKTPQVNARLGRVRKALSEVATVTAATEGLPRPSAVVISLSAWKVERGHTILNRKIAAHARMTSAAAPPSRM